MKPMGALFLGPGAFNELQLYLMNSARDNECDVPVTLFDSVIRVAIVFCVARTF
jgi:hypothetical protein